jgi:hypothetical protein
MGIEGALVGRLGTSGPAAAAPVRRELALTGLVDEIRRERANRRGIALTVGGDQAALAAIAATAHGADEVAREEPADGTPVEAALQREERTESETAEQHECNELGGRLAALGRLPAL